MKKGLVVAGIIILVIAGVILAMVLNNREAEAPAVSEETLQQQTAADQDTNTTEKPAEQAEQAGAVVINYTDDGFVPQQYTAEAGASVTINNRSTNTLDFASDDHPVHQDNTELNAGSISPGSSRTIVLNATGEWGFHNHENSSHQGTITVE